MEKTNKETSFHGYCSTNDNQTLHNKIVPMPKPKYEYLFVEDIKQSIKEFISKGEILKNGCFVINYKEFKEIFGEGLC